MWTDTDRGNSSTERQNFPKSSFYRTKKDLPSLNDKDPAPVENSTGSNGSNATAVLAKGKGKGKVHPRTDHEAKKGSRGRELLFL
jgi:hypothetical protein